MTQLLVFKEQVQKFYQNYALVLNTLFRFAIGFVVFYAINKVIGYSPLLNQTWVEVLSGCISMVFPVQVLLFLASVFITLQIAYVSNYLAVTMGMMLAVLYFMYVRFLPKHGFVILAMPVLYALNIPYVLPVLMGLVATPVAVIPRNRKTDYAFEAAIITGSFLNLILFLVVNYLMDININILSLLLGIAISCLLVWIIQVFRLPLNYAGAENLQFEDDEYYYYVRAVPKMNVTAARKKVKHFNTRNSTDNGGLEAEEQESDILAQGKVDLKENKDISHGHDFDFTVSLDKEDLEEIEKEN